MSASLNKVQLIGRIGRKPNVITTKEGGLLIAASLATNEPVKQNGERQDKAEWHSLLFLGNHTKVAAQLQPGQLIYVEGKLRSNYWTDSAGHNHQDFKILVNQLQFLSPKPKNEVFNEKITQESPSIAQENLDAIHKHLNDDLDEFLS